MTLKQFISRFKHIGDQILPCRKIGHDHSGVIIYIKFVPSCMLSFNIIGLLVLGKNMFEDLYVMYRRGGHFGHVFWTIYTNPFPFPMEVSHEILL